ncbi:MAG: hypothetical protein ACLSHC_18905 [Bilophila wadsworthia]
MVARLQQDFERVIEKRTACNTKRYPGKWKQLPDEEALLLPRIQEDILHDRNGTDADAEPETDGGELQHPADGLRHEDRRTGGQTMLIQTELRTLKRLFNDVSSVQQLADLVGDLENGA